MLAELWPSDEDIDAAVSAFVRPELFGGGRPDLLRGPEAWRAITGHGSATYRWQERSTYLRRPPYFEVGASARLDDIYGARAFLMLGDSVTTDHISPAGAIPVDSAAGQYLGARGVAPAAFNQYSTRRGNHEVMLRGLFSNRRLRNELTDAESGPPLVKVQLDGRQELLPVYEAALRYSDTKLPLLIFAGRDYGGGSSRDWAAKGPRLAGIRAVIAESFERIHRSNLIGMGILPLELPQGTSRHALRLTGEENFDLFGLSELTEPLGHVTLRIHRSNGAADDVRLLLRAQTATEVEYLRHGGLLPYVLERLLASSKAARDEAR
jgi:aconitate hydratase